MFSSNYGMRVVVHSKVISDVYGNTSGLTLKNDNDELFHIFTIKISMKKKSMLRHNAGYSF